MKNQELAEKCKTELISLKERLNKTGETKKRRLEAEAVAFQALQNLKVAQKALAKEVDAQEGREAKIEKHFKAEMQKAKDQCQAQLEEAGQALKAVEASNGDLKKNVEKLEKKSDLWKSMADFL